MKGEPWTKVYESACADTRLSDRDLRVFIAVKLRARESGSCWESVETIGKRAGGMSARSVQRSLDVLKKYSYLAEIPDPGKKTGRRLTPVRSVVGGPTVLSQTPDKSDAPPPTVLSPNQEHGSRAQGRTTTMTVESSSSSPHGFQQGKGTEETKRVETDAEFDLRMEAQDALTMAFPTISVDQVSATIREFGSAIVKAAAKSYRPAGRASEWRYFEGICKNMRAEGGPPPEPAPRPNRADERTDAREAMAHAIFGPRPTKSQRNAAASAARRDSVAKLYPKEVETPTEDRPLKPSEKVPMTYHVTPPRQPIPESERGGRF